MSIAPSDREWVRYKHARFTARFPADFLYSPSHYWMRQVDDSLWQVGFTKFATRMLGELVDFVFNPAIGDPVSQGMDIGHVEGFKAASDVFCIMDGNFAGSNPALAADACLVRSDPYLDGWLYSISGNPPADALDVHAYIALLNTTITRMAEQEHAAE